MARKERTASAIEKPKGIQSLDVDRIADEEVVVTGAGASSKDGDVAEVFGVKGGARDGAEGWLGTKTYEGADGRFAESEHADAEERYYDVTKKEAVAAAESGTGQGLVRGAAESPPPVTALTMASVFEACEEPPEVVDIPRLPSVLRQDTATVYVRALVEMDGSVSEVEVERSSGIELLDSIALMNVQQARFRSGQDKGKAVRCWISLPQSFEEEEKPAETDSDEDSPQEQ
jgi:TonB family protein